MFNLREHVKKALAQGDVKSLYPHLMKNGFLGEPSWLSNLAIASSIQSLRTFTLMSRSVARIFFLWSETPEAVETSQSPR